MDYTYRVYVCISNIQLWKLGTRYWWDVVIDSKKRWSWTIPWIFLGKGSPRRVCMQYQWLPSSKWSKQSIWKQWILMLNHIHLSSRYSTSTNKLPLNCLCIIQPCLVHYITSWCFKGVCKPMASRANNPWKATTYIEPICLPQFTLTLTRLEV